MPRTGILLATQGAKRNKALFYVFLVFLKNIGYIFFMEGPASRGCLVPSSGILEKVMQRNLRPEKTGACKQGWF